MIDIDTQNLLVDYRLLISEQREFIAELRAELLHTQKVLSLQKPAVDD